MSQSTITDEDLTAHLDGEADAVTRTAIEDALASDSQLIKRLEGLDIPLDRLRAEGAALAEAVPPVVMPDVRPAPSKGWLVAASLIFGLLLGAGAMRLANPQDTWVDAIANYQALYVPATLAGDVQPVEITKAVVSAFEAEAGISLTGVTEIAGLTFKRAQTLGIEGRRLLQLAYVTEDGRPVAYCLTTVQDRDRLARHSVTYGLGAVDWVKDGVGYVLVGDLAADQLHALQATLPGA